MKKNVCVYTYVHAELRPSLCDSMLCSLPGFSSMGFSMQEYWNGLLFPSPGYVYVFVCVYELNHCVKAEINTTL